MNPIELLGSCRARTFSFVVLLSAGLLLLLPTPSAAVPSFSRQTGMACAACHTIFPELTPFGRSFKISGYVIANLKTVRDILANREDILELDQIPPLSFMFQTSYTDTKKALPDSGVPAAFAKNGNVLFPQQASLFYGGRIARQLGAFIQFTYSTPDDHFTWDNTVFTYADNLSDNERGLVWGLTLNNNPTVQDPWNSTPAWGFPWAASSIAPVPAAATLLDGTLAQKVAGLTAYVFWNNALYAEVGAYRSAQALCHGPEAEGKDQFPRLAGQHAAYLVKQLESFRSGLRASPVMQPIAAGLSEGNMQAVAAFLRTK